MTKAKWQKSKVSVALSLRGLYHFDNKTVSIVLSLLKFDVDEITIFLRSRKIRISTRRLYD